ncbi:MAG: peptidase M23 [Nitrosomonadales bacterium]|nr:MAG: peptidase M23 [Nitrosomonadales bacterium]
MLNNKDRILSQKLFQSERKIRLRWLVGLSALPLFGVVAAFGIAPDTEIQHIQTRTVVEQLALPSMQLASGNKESFWREERIQRGDTVSALLNRLDVNSEDVQSFLSEAQHAQALRQLKPGKTIQALTTQDGELLSLRYNHGGDSMLLVEKRGDHFKTSEQPLPLERQVEMKSGRITSSLFAATDDARVPDAVAIQMADIFSTDIDFHRDLQRGDKFTLVYETFYNKGELVKTGRILAAEFINSGKVYRAVYFQGQDGRGGYYTEDGKNLRKAFLRSPLEFSRISSGFSTARYHPVLKEWRAHKGVDYAAPTGTRVKSTADGSVAFVGRQNGYGNIVIIKHQGNYETVYGHLSGFANGLRKGQRVNQGDVIGYVGMTGLATGPHLHYEFKVAGVQRNPLSIEVPVAFPIAAGQKGEFNRSTQPLMARLELLRGTNLAALD